MSNRHSQPTKGSATIDGRAVLQSHLWASQAWLIPVPLPREDQHGKPMNTLRCFKYMDRRTLIAALDHVANRIAQSDGNVTIVAVGGAVNTLHLRSRAQTHEVDFFGTCADNHDRVLLSEVIYYAHVHCRNLGPQWLNTETEEDLQRPLHHSATLEALAQNVKVFEAPQSMPPHGHTPFLPKTTGC